jgi:glyceraldehyde-3-phosphate dehydrogenase/erythrose-4-phosphate dehydrogenase
MGQRTLAFTRLLFREVSCNTLGNHRLLVVYAKQSFIQHTLGITIEQYTKPKQQSKHMFNSKVNTHRCILGLG